MKADLLLIIHFHQPVGNFDSVIRRVHDKCYKPFLDIVSLYPGIKMSMHFSGCLLEWFEKNTPEIFDTIGKLVRRGQIELIGGGFYEPILPIIPEKDRIGQITMMREYLKSHFGRDPKGAWVAERVWEPELVSTLARCGVEYIVLDDIHFLYAGLKKEDIYGYFISEDNGSSVRIFPSDKELRYAIPFSEPDRPISYMRQVAEKKENVIFTYGDDAEKFGEWPGTYKWVYDDKWLVKFMDLLSKNDSWLKTRTVSECIKDNKPLGRIYLPSASYEEMLEWALPADASIALHGIKEEIKRENKSERYGPFIRGGFFRNFLAKYEESNQMHKRMLYVSNLLKNAAGVSDSKIKAAYRELYKSQCNCSYWHGVFGGLYLYHLRKSIYEHMLKAENIYNEITATGKSQTHSEVLDFDIDGFDEVVLQNKNMWICVKPSSGGSIVEMDAKEENVNILNVLTRYKEAYHRDIVIKNYAEEGEHTSIHDKMKPVAAITTGLIYDTYRRSMFRDHFFKEETTLDSFERMDYAEDGDFANALYDFKIDKDSKNQGIIMMRAGLAHGVPVSIRKQIILNGATLKILYKITNTGREKKKFWFGTEIAFMMPDADSSRYAYGLGRKKERDMTLISRGATEGLEDARVIDNKGEFSITISFSKSCDLWRFPIKTVSQSEKSYEENYQGSVIVPNWRFTIKSHKSVTFDVELRLKV